ncbi:phospho-sugar mutase [Microaceticoccus formicicus]|uniref:phospho-sugar mutase n=1 Tax=Microaceticoccus formicicus TaxID=3118105 RepID=UPI003CD05058|nr:phospho-sugar mutase [Peptoniphilaceae bacterium AMB_02]
MDYMKNYLEWMENPIFDEETKIELKELTDEEEIKDRFYQNLEFGTAGLRGKIGAGTNRMNQYTVGLATQGFAETILKRGEEAKKRGVAICYDVRHKSKEFSELASSIFAANGIKVYLYKTINPTPVLSYTIRKLKTIAGVMVTASHNPMEYNGYKAYWEEGSQILEGLADEILKAIEELGSYDKVKKIPFNDAMASGMVEYIDDSVYESYIEDVLNYSINEDIDKNVNIVYSPLNGTGNIPVREVLRRRGFTNINIVKEQELPDPDFTTVGYPNPEDPKAFKLAIELGKKVNADLLLATDPDCDRAAIEVLNKDGEYEFVNGNKIGALLINYILSQRSKLGNLPENGVIVKSIVTGDLSKAIADEYGIEVVETLTGFKNISGKANEYDITGDKKFLFGYEESIGYTYGDSVRDKDAVNSSMMIAEMAGYYKKHSQSLLDVLEDLYKKHGYYNEDLISIVLTGLDGQQRISRIMEEFRKNPIRELNGIKLVKIIDYLNDETGNPKSNVLKYYYEDGSWFALRPSGTEPKIKLYIYSVGKTLEDSEDKIKCIKEVGINKIESVE